MSDEFEMARGWADGGGFRHCVTRGTLTLLLLAFTPVSIESARWWHSPRLVRALQLTPAQRGEIDHIFQTALAQRAVFEAQADAAHAAVEGLLDRNVSDAELESAVSRAADADAARRRLRTMMLYRMYSVLSPEQRLQLSDLAQDKYAREERAK